MSYRFLQEGAASPIAQKFVECADPIASGVEFDLELRLRTIISLTFRYACMHVCMHACIHVFIMYVSSVCESQDCHISDVVRYVCMHACMYVFMYV